MHPNSITTSFGFVQVASRVSTTFRFTFPAPVRRLLDYLTIFEFINPFNFATSPGCLYSMDVYERLFVQTAVPLMVLGIIYAAYRCTRSSGFKSVLFDVFFLLSFVVYPSVNNALFTFFDCKVYEDGEVRGIKPHCLGQTSRM